MGQSWSGARWSLRVALMVCACATGCDDASDDVVSGSEPVDQGERSDACDGSMGDGDGDAHARDAAASEQPDAAVSPRDDAGGHAALADAGPELDADGGLLDASAEPSMDAATPDAEDASVAPDASDVDAGGAGDRGDAGHTCEPSSPVQGPQGPNRASGAFALGPEGCGSPDGEDPTKLLDSSSDTKWLCFASTPVMAVAFAEGKTYAVNTYSLTSGGDAPERDPKSWRFEGSNDGATWTLVDRRVNQVFDARGLTRSFYFANCQAFARYRLVVEANNGGDGIFQLAELRMYGPAGTDLPVAVSRGGEVTSDCPNTQNPVEDAPAAFDGRADTKWFCGGRTAVSLSYAFAADAAHAITRYTVTAGNDSADRDPRDWVMEGSDDGLTWTALEPAQQGQVFAERYETRAYTLSNGTAYKRYRLNVSANNGSVDFQVADVALYTE